MRRSLTGASLLLAVVGCALPESSEQALGDEMAAQVAREMPLSRDTALDAWLDRLGARLTAVADTAPRDWHFTVVDDDAINAFAIPGGHIYMHRGLLARAGDMAEVAGVLGHEIAHVTLRHTARQLGQRTKTSAVVSIFCGLTGWCSGDLAQVAIEVGGAALMARYSRNDEAEADSAAVHYLVEAGIDPAGVTDMFRRIAAERARAPGRLEAFFSSHPVDEARIAATSRLIEQLGPAQGVLTREDSTFRQVQPRLAGAVP